jgi:hypothetical protein
MGSDLMKNISSDFIFAVLISIAGCKQATTLKLADLKFADYEKDKIAANKIAYTYFNSTDQSANNYSGKTGYNVYDQLGNLVGEYRNNYDGHSVTYNRDSIGFVTFKNFSTDYSAKFRVSYHFLPDSLLLYQYWNGFDNDTSTFRFDKNGILLEAIEYANDYRGKGKHFKTTYEYNADKHLVKKTEIALITKEQLKQWELKELAYFSTRNTLSLFYTAGNLDSTIASYYFPSSPSENYSAKT